MFSEISVLDLFCLEFAKHDGSLF